MRFERPMPEKTRSPQSGRERGTFDGEQPRIAASVATRCGIHATAFGLCLALSTGCSPAEPQSNASKFVAHPFVVSTADRGALDEPSAVEAAIERATEYLVTNVREDGRFIYLRDELSRDPSDASATGQASYNLLRHAGAMYALCQRYQWKADPRIPPVLTNAAKFLTERTVAALEDDPDILAIWTTKELTGEQVPRLAKLGGTGLGLVGLLSVEAIAPGTTSAEQIAGLGRFLLFMQRSDGGFYSRYVPASGGYDTEWVSLYYPGEAALAFVHLYHWDRDVRWYNAALASLLYLAESRDGQLRVPADHWALLATDQLLRIEHPRPLQADRRKLLRHTRQVCRVMLNEQHTNPSSPHFGCFSPDGRTTPTSTRVEGMTAALAFLPADRPAFRMEVESACRSAVRFLAAAQYSSGPLAGGMPKAIGVVDPPLTKAARELNQTSTEVRVDYVQHALSAWLQWTERPERPRQPHRPIE